MNEQETQKWKSYQTALAYTSSRFSKSMITSYAADERFCILAESIPTMKEVEAHFHDGGVLNWLNEIIQHICAISSIHVDAMQSETAARTIYNRYGAMRLSEIMLFASKMMAGDFEKFFGSFDIQVLTKSMYQFQSYRNNVIAREEQDKMRKDSQTKVDGRETFLEYLRLLQLAVYGDKDAMSLLHLNTYEDMVRCVAMRVKNKSFPISILDHIAEDFRPLAQSIIEHNMNFTGL